MHYTTILEATLHKEQIGKELKRSGKNVLVSDNKPKIRQNNR